MSRRIMIIAVEGEDEHLDQVISGAEELATWLQAEAEEAGIASGVEITYADASGDDILTDLPQMVEQYMLYSIDGQDLVLDMNAILSALDYLADKPLMVSTAFLRLMTAVRKAYGELNAKLAARKNDLSAKVSLREAHFYSDDYELSTRKTKAVIDALVEVDPEVVILKNEVSTLEHRKAELWGVKDAIEQAFSLCEAFIRSGGPNMKVENAGRRDRSFNEITAAFTRFHGQRS